MRIPELVGGKWGRKPSCSCHSSLQRSTGRLPGWFSGKETACQCRRHGFNPWSGKIAQASEQQNPCATTIEPVPLSQELKWLKPFCTRAHALKKEKSPQWKPFAPQLKSSPHSPRLEKSPHSNKDPAQFSRQEHWSGLPFPPPGDLSDSGSIPNLWVSCISRQILCHCVSWEAQN